MSAKTWWRERGTPARRRESVRRAVREQRVDYDDACAGWLVDDHGEEPHARTLGALTPTARRMAERGELAFGPVVERVTAGGNPYATQRVSEAVR